MIRFSKTRLILGSCLLLVLFSACRPKGVLSRKEMARVLFDVHLTEVAVSGTYEPVPEAWTHGLQADYFKDMAFRSVLKKHHLNEEEFYNSVSWYSKHMNQFEKVYADVQTRMDDFIAAIDRGQFENTRASIVVGTDTAKMRSMYTFGQYRPDTIPVHRLYLVADSLPSTSKWLTKQWLYKLPKDTSRLNLYPKLSIHSVFNTSDPDSLRKMADSLLRQSPTPSVKKELLVPGARRLPTRNFREVPKDEQIRRKYQQRARELERSKLTEQELERRKRIEASKQQETNHWK